MQFISTYKIRGSSPCNYQVDVIKNEPMFFNCDLAYAFKNGDEITKDFISSLPEDWLTCNPEEQCVQSLQSLKRLFEKE